MLTLAIDQGTHATRAVAFDAQGRIVAHSAVPVSLQRNGRTSAEQSPAEILDSLRNVLRTLFRHPQVAAGHIRAAGLATQRSSVLAWERETGTALSPVLSWQDTRAAGYLQGLERHRGEIKLRTGLPLSAHYGAGKLHWLLHNEASVAAAQGRGQLVIGPLTGFLLHHLLAGHANVIDHANAARTLLWNLHEHDWDDWLLELFGIPRHLLPACLPTLATYGVTREAGIPVTAVNGDQTAALYAHGIPAPHTIRVNIGTGAFALATTGGECPVHPQLLTGLACSSDREAGYFIEGTINGAGASLQWMASRLALTEWETSLPAWLDTVTVPPVFLNTVGGLGAPWWRAGPEPVFLDTGTTPGPAQAMAGVVESIVFLIQANIELLLAHNPRLDRIRVSGGLAKTDGLCRKLASLSGLVVERPVETEATARGIAWLAAGRPDDWQQPEAGARFEPGTDAGLASRYRWFLEALDSCS
jgi:glycerol kinase